MATDFLGIGNDLLNEDEKIIRETIGKFVDLEVLPIITGYFEDDRFPVEIVSKLAEMGLLGIKTDPRFGGTGAGHMIYGLICQELERADSGLRSFVSVQNSLVMYPIEKFGSEEQKNKWLPLLAQGKIGCFGLTEPDFGSNPGGMKTRAVKKGNTYILNGSKLWITNGNIADLAIVWAKTDPADQTGKSLRGFLVETNRPGFAANKIKHKWSLRASETAELVLEDVEIAEADMLPGSLVGIKAPLLCLNEARYGIAWGAIGAAIACYECALNYCLTRIQFEGKPIASHQLVQADLVEMLTEITKAQLIAWRLGKLMEDHRANPIQVSMAKMNNVKMALEVARKARNLLGANGISLEYPIMRHMTNLESVFTYEGTDNIHKLAIGRHITGISAFS